MRVIARSTLRDFWKQPAYRDSETSLRTWFDVAINKAKWASHDDVKKDFGAKVDLAYGRYVFDVHGNKYRLICKIDFARHGVLTLWIGTHRDYDKLCEHNGSGLKAL